MKNRVFIHFQRLNKSFSSHYVIKLVDTILNIIVQRKTFSPLFSCCRLFVSYFSSELSIFTVKHIFYQLFTDLPYVLHTQEHNTLKN